LTVCDYLASFFFQVGTTAEADANRKALQAFADGQAAVRTATYDYSAALDAYNAVLAAIQSTYLQVPPLTPWE
jgi:formate-dependent phosphoribosylglycinamide formyltransferase (GAR transformylase)